MSEVEKEIESAREYHILIIGEGAVIGTSSDFVRALIVGHIDVEQLTIEELDKDPRREMFTKVFALPIVPAVIPFNEMLQYVECLEVDELDITKRAFISKKRTSKEVYQALKQTYIKNYQMLNDYENAALRVGAKRLQKLR